MTSIPHSRPSSRQIINKALEKDRELRYQSAAEMRTDLTRLQRSTAGARRRLLRLAAAGTFALMLIAGAVFWFTQRQPSFMPGLKQRQLTANTSDNPVREEWISPDGSQLAYSDQKGIHIKLIAGGETQTLPTPEALKGMDVAWGVGPWLHDGARLIAIAGVVGQGPSTWTLSLMGGAARKLRDDADTQDMSPDGSLLVFTTNPGKIGDREIWLMDSNGEQARRLCETDENSSFNNFGWSPDGQRIAYLRNRQTPAKWEETLESRDLRGGPPTTILSSGPWWQKGGLRDFLWLPGGRLIYILGDNDLNGFSCNYWEILVDEHTGEPRSQPRQLSNWAGFCLANLSATADGKRIAYIRYSFQRSVQVADLDASGTRISNPRRLTVSEGNEYPTGWTADSKAVIFHSNRNGPWGIFKQVLNQETPEAIVMGTDDSVPAASVLSPDGSSLIYTLLPKDNGGASSLPGQIMRIPIAGGVPQPLMTALLSGPPRCSKSPVALCVIAERTPDRAQLIFTRLDPMKGRGRELTRVVVDPSENYSWDLSSDGTRIAVAREAGRRFDILSLEGRATQTITVKGWDIGVDMRIGGYDLRGVDFDWAADGKGLFISGRTPQKIGAVVRRFAR